MPATTSKPRTARKAATPRPTSVRPEPVEGAATHTQPGIPASEPQPVEVRAGAAARTTLQPLPVVDQLQACCPDLFAGPLSDEDAQVAARLFKALADPARVKLISMIAAAEGQEVCVCDLVDDLDLAQPTVSHHLKVLLDAGLLDRERRASWAFYRLRPGALATVAKALGGVC
ncbi:MAG: metalloregulator ArsR/SmtB family transcription factor [Dehalococcoidia bacterium]|nr:metalloregulator ArsR/SmtB family transcription factor [Dehalococcoidia bacterium]